MRRTKPCIVSRCSKLIVRIKAFSEVLPAMTVVVKQAIEVDDEQDARDALEVFENLLVAVLSTVFLDLTRAGGCPLI